LMISFSLHLFTFVAYVYINTSMFYDFYFQNRQFATFTKPIYTIRINLSYTTTPYAIPMLLLDKLAFGSFVTG
jgi:hypothetical protein